MDLNAFAKAGYEVYSAVAEYIKSWFDDDLPGGRHPAQLQLAYAGSRA